jgi:hypothetical protein
MGEIARLYACKPSSALRRISTTLDAAEYILNSNTQSAGTRWIIFEPVALIALYLVFGAAVSCLIVET